jgi:hypothetical protein
MSRITTIRRAAAAGGATGLIALSLAGPAAARPDPGTGELTHCTSDCYQGGSPATSAVLTANDNAVEYVQLGAGVLAGIALTGGAVAVLSRRSHTHAAHPA